MSNRIANIEANEMYNGMINALGTRSAKGGGARIPKVKIGSTKRSSYSVVVDHRQPVGVRRSSI